jgi:hypothetical protein
VKKEGSAKEHFVSVRAALTNGTVWHLGILFLLTVIGCFGYSFWGPLLIKALFHVSNFEVGLVSARDQRRHHVRHVSKRCAGGLHE